MNDPTQLEAGPALDVAVAERVLRLAAGQPIPLSSRSTAAAMAVVEALRQIAPGAIAVAITATLDHEYLVEIRDYIHMQVYDARAASFPLAACRAALAAIDGLRAPVEEEEE